MADRVSSTVLHASCVAFADAAVLILGVSGSGKSALALQLMAHGAILVSDDRTELVSRQGRLYASAPATIRGLIEARGVGILKADSAPAAPVSVVVDLDRAGTERLPPLHVLKVLDQELPCLHKIDGPHFPAAILQYLKAGRQDPR